MKKFLKVVGILSVFIAALLYVVFRIMFFDPFEGEVPRLDTLIPRDAEIMIRREQLDRDFVDFPTPDFFATLRLKRDWKEFTETADFADWSAKLDLGAKIEQLQQQLSQIKPFDALTDFLGREVMLVGRPREDESFGYAALIRGSFRAKVAVAGFGIESLRGLAKDAIQSYQEHDGVASVTLHSGETIHLFRLKDVIVAGDDAELVQDIYKISRGSGLSLSDSPQYASAMSASSDVGRPIDFAFHLGNLARANGFARFEADPYEPMEQWLARSVAPGDFEMAIGRLFLGDELQLDMRLGADVASLRPGAGGIFSGSSGDLKDMYDFCANVFPENVYLCGYMKLEVAPFLRRLEACIDQDTRELLNEFVAQIKRRNPQLPISNAAGFVSYFSECVANELAFALEPQTPYHIPQTPENDMVFPEKSWGPRLALLMPVSNLPRAEGLLGDVTRAIKASAQQVAKVYNWSYQEHGIGFQEIELADADYPSLAVGFFELEGREFMIFTTTGQFLSEIVRVKVEHERGFETGISQNVNFQLAERVVDGFGQGLFYLSSDGLKTSLSNLIEWQVEMQTQPDWQELRAQAERRIRDQRYPGERGREITLERRRELTPEVDAEMDRIDLEWRSETIPEEVEKRRQNLEALDLVRWLALTLRINDRDLELHARISTAANFPQ